ncbi:MAG: DMT family transporter [Clostridia bacterium]|nr:DMT family transporter [Clostridia bacterium]
MKEKQRANLTPILLALVVMMCWGSLYPVVKLGYEKFEIDTAYYPNLLLFAGVRFTVSGALITLLLGVKNKAVPTVKTGKEWIGIAIVGLFSVMLNYSLAFYGLSIVASSKTALLKQAGALIFIVISALLFKESKMTIGKGIGAVLGACSIVILNINQLGISMGFGETIIILSSFCTVTASVVCKKMLKNTDSIVVTGYSQLFGGVILLIVGIACGGTMSFAEMGDWLLFAYMVVATCASYLIWYTIVQKNDLSKLFIVKLSEPLFAAIIGAIILREDIFQLHYLGAFLCIATAVIISNLTFKRKTRVPVEPKIDENT